MRTLLAAASSLLLLATVACSGNDAPPSENPSPSAQTTFSGDAGTSIAPSQSTSTTPVTAIDPNATPPAGSVAVDGGAATPGACSVTTPNPTCNACVQQFCCPLVSACDADPSCVAADQCVSQCAQYASVPQYQAQCESVCATQNPTGAEKLRQVYQCAKTSCVGKC